jgi:YVTN family beta-propeller protein
LFLRINSTDNSIADTIKVGENPRKLALNPNDNLLYVANLNNKTVSVINTTDNSIADTIKVSEYVASLSFNPTKNLLYLGNRDNNTVSVINCKTTLL